MRKLTPAFHGWHQKLVSQIVAGKFIELNKLLSTNLVLSKPKPQLLFDGQLVLTSTTQVVCWWHNQFVRSLFSMVLSYPPISRIAGKICCNISCSSSRHTTSLLAMSLVSIGLGFSQTCCCHKPYRLVNHQCAVQRLITAYVKVNVHMYNFISLNLFSLIHAEFYACN